jgi:CheY-like chemotaxis protein
MHRNDHKCLRVLVVEDDPLMFMAIEDILLSDGYVVVGPVSSVDAAIDAIQMTDRYDIALLDVNLGGEAIDPVAYLLQQRGMPFVFSTGYDCTSILNRWPAALAVQKPWWPETLLNTLAIAATMRPAVTSFQITTDLALKATADIAAVILTLESGTVAAQSA